MSIDIEYQKKRLLIKYPFFRSTIAKLKFVEDVNCLGYNGQPTAGTNNEVVAYHPDFMNSLDEDEQLFILAHEVGHVALNHVLRSNNRDPKIWNIATDAVLNANLIKDGLKFVKGGVNITDAINYDAETLYNILIELKEKTPPNNNENNSKSTTKKGNNSLDGVNIKDLNLNDFNENDDVGFDTHNIWSDAVKKSKYGNQDSKDDTDNKQSFLDKLLKNSKDLDSVYEHEETQNDTSSMGEQEAFKQNREEKKKLLKELRDSFASKSMNSGDQSSQSIRNIDNIGTSIPLIDWRKLLKESLKFDVDWTYRNCTIEDGVLTPHLEEIPTPETEIVLDTSGSINDTLLRNFLRECKNILQTSRVKVGCFDTKFYGFQEIKSEKDIDNMKFMGHGGTDFDVAVDAFSRRVENKIIFTDGQATMPKKTMDAIWIVFGGKKINPIGGKVIYITDEQLSRLNTQLNYDNIESNKIR